MIGFIEFELLQGELSIDEGGHIIAAMGFERLVYHNQIAVIDSYILHGISGDLGIESGLGVLDEGLVQVDGFGQIVLGRTGKACLDAAVYIGKVQFRGEVGGLDMQFYFFFHSVIQLFSNLKDLSLYEDNNDSSWCYPVGPLRYGQGIGYRFTQVDNGISEEGGMDHVWYAFPCGVKLFLINFNAYSLIPNNESNLWHNWFPRQKNLAESTIPNLQMDD